MKKQTKKQTVKKQTMLQKRLKKVKSIIKSCMFSDNYKVRPHNCSHGWFDIEIETTRLVHGQVINELVDAGFSFMVDLPYGDTNRTVKLILHNDFPKEMNNDPKQKGKKK